VLEHGKHTQVFKQS